jgi:hypothetical protein
VTCIIAVYGKISKHMAKSYKIKGEDTMSGRIKKISLGLASAFILMAPAVPALAMNDPKIPTTRPGVFMHHHAASVSASGQSTSSNWSGYAATATNNSFNTISSSWVQPAVNCSVIKTSYSAYWVGLDGYSDSTVEQIGSEANCINGAAQYYTWYEMYPQNPSEMLTRLSVASGNSLTATVTYNPPVITTTTTRGRTRQHQSPASFTMTLADTTTGSSYATTQSATRQTANRSSAEVITEAPWSGGVLPLSNFGSANYTSSLVNGSALGSATGLQSITMYDPYGMVATPSALDASGQLFNVAWSDPV